MLIRFHLILFILFLVLNLEIFRDFWLFCVMTSCVKIFLTFYEFFYVNSFYGKTFQENEFLNQSVFTWSLQGHYFKEKTFLFRVFLEKTFQKIIFEQQTIQEHFFLRQNFLEHVEQTLHHKFFLGQKVLEQAFKEIIF